MATNARSIWIEAVAAVRLFEVERWQAARMALRPHRQLSAEIRMDLAFVGGEGEQTKDLNRVLLAPLPDATIGQISSGRKHNYATTFRERSGRRLAIAFKRAGH